MKKQLGNPSSTKSQDSHARQTTCALVQKRNNFGDMWRAARREAIDDAIRTWIVPALVRRFLAEKVSSGSATSTPKVPLGGLR